MSTDAMLGKLRNLRRLFALLFPVALFILMECLN
jgi:hypothetical protein